MEEMIAEHRVKATVDECYILTKRISESERLTLEFTGELDEDTGGFRSMTCEILQQRPVGTVLAGTLEFLDLTQGGALLQVYAMTADDGAATGGGAPSPQPAGEGLVRRVLDLVLTRLLDEGLLA
jgi:hypothetical protein